MLHINALYSKRIQSSVVAQIQVFNDLKFGSRNYRSSFLFKLFLSL